MQKQIPDTGGCQKHTEGFEPAPPVRIGTCLNPKCQGDVMWEKDGPYCSNRCGLRMGEIWHTKLSKKQMSDFFAGQIIEVTNDQGQKKNYKNGGVKQIRSRTTGRMALIIDAVEQK